MFYQQGVVDFKSRLCHKVVVRLEGDSEPVGFGVETGRRLLPAPATPNDSAGFRLVLHFHKVIPAAPKRERKITQEHAASQHGVKLWILIRQQQRRTLKDVEMGVVRQAIIQNETVKQHVETLKQQNRFIVLLICVHSLIFHQHRDINLGLTVIGLSIFDSYKWLKLLSSGAKSETNLYCKFYKPSVFLLFPEKNFLKPAWSRQLARPTLFILTLGCRQVLVLIWFLMSINQAYRSLFSTFISYKVMDDLQIKTFLSLSDKKIDFAKYQPALYEGWVQNQIRWKASYN